MADIDFDYILGAVDWLASHPHVQVGGIGVIGASKGGEVAFLLGMTTNKVKALVNICGAPFYSFEDLKKSGQVYWKGVKLNTNNLKYTDEGVYLKDNLGYGIEVIPAWKNNAQILYLLGEDDGVMPIDHAKYFIETCPEEKRKNIELVSYPGTGHRIEPPYMPMYRTLYHPVLGMTLVVGGHPEAHAAAEEDAWRRLLNFLHKHLPHIMTIKTDITVLDPPAEDIRSPCRHSVSVRVISHLQDHLVPVTRISCSVVCYTRRTHIKFKVPCVCGDFNSGCRIQMDYIEAVDKIHPSPRVALVDERVSITANSLRPLQRVTVQAWVEEGKAVFSSCGHFLADQQGQIDVSQHTSVGGTYKGVDNMGLFWSMNPVPGVSVKPILRKVDVMTPLVFRLSVMDDHIPFDDLQLPSSVVLATGELQRWYKHRTVRRIEVHVGSLRGTIFLPEGKGPFPGVLDMFGSTGGLVEFRAALLASRGFASFALAYFNYDDLPCSLADVDFDYLLDAVHWLASHPHVKPGGIGVVGSSKGGEMAFLLGMATDKVKVLVNISGPSFPTFEDVKKSGEIYWKGVKMDATKVKHTDEGVCIKDVAPYATEVIPAWKNNAQILYLLGDDDAVWNTDHANTFVRSCPEEKRKNINLVTYPGGGHLIEPPYMPLYRAMYHPLLGSMLVMGGHPEAHAATQEDAWRRLLHFIQKHVA